MLLNNPSFFKSLTFCRSCNGDFELSKIQNSTASSYIYIYAFIYVGYTEKQYIEKQDALSAVSCSLRDSNEPATLLNERPNQKIQIFSYVVGMKRCISLLKSASHSATLSFQPTLTETKSLVY